MCVGELMEKLQEFFVLRNIDGRCCCYLWIGRWGSLYQVTFNRIIIGKLLFCFRLIYTHWHMERFEILFSFSGKAKVADIWNNIITYYIFPIFRTIYDVSTHYSRRSPAQIVSVVFIILYSMFSFGSCFLLNCVLFLINYLILSISRVCCCRNFES